MKMKTKIIAFLLAGLMIFDSLSLSVYAENYSEDGTGAINAETDEEILGEEEIIDIDEIVEESEEEDFYDDEIDELTEDDFDEDEEVEERTLANAGDIKNPIISEDGNVTWDCVWFGRYWQNDTDGDGVGTTDDKMQPIKWMVLSVDGNDAFLMSASLLDNRPFVHGSDSDDGTMYWENSTIRSWLNSYNGTENISGLDYSHGSFFDRAFTDTESDAIFDTTVTASPNNAAAGDDTVDKIYLPSMEELTNAEYGFINPSSSEASYIWRVTGKRFFYDHNISSEYNEWWSRTKKNNTAGTFYNVGRFGWILNNNGNYYESNWGTKAGIRPVLHLDLSKDVWQYAGTIKANKSEQKVNEIDCTIENPTKNTNTYGLSKPKKVDSSNIAWDSVYVGEYPQSEVVDIRTYSGMRYINNLKDYIIDNTGLYYALKNADASKWKNNVISLEGSRYLRVKKSNARKTAVGVDGKYNWDDDTTYHFFKFEPIKWRVLKIDDGKAFLISDKIIDYYRYDNSMFAYYSDSIVRSWLNGYDASYNAANNNYSSSNFINRAFSSDSPVIRAVVEDDFHYSPYTSPDGRTSLGNPNLYDYVSLFPYNSSLWTKQYEKMGMSYPGSYDAAKQAKATAYSLAMGEAVGVSGKGAGYGNWALRDTEGTNDFKWTTTEGEMTKWEGHYTRVCNTLEGIRPCVWIDLSADGWTYAGKIYKTPVDNTVTDTTAKESNYIVAGKYDLFREHPEALIDNGFDDFLEHFEDRASDFYSSISDEESRWASFAYAFKNYSDVLVQEGLAKIYNYLGLERDNRIYQELEDEVIAELISQLCVMNPVSKLSSVEYYKQITGVGKLINNRINRKSKERIDEIEKRLVELNKQHLKDFNKPYSIKDMQLRAWRFYDSINSFTSAIKDIFSGLDEVVSIGDVIVSMYNTSLIEEDYVYYLTRITPTSTTKSALSRYCKTVTNEIEDIGRKFIENKLYAQVAKGVKKFVEVEFQKGIEKFFEVSSSPNLMWAVFEETCSLLIKLKPAVTADDLIKGYTAYTNMRVFENGIKGRVNKFMSYKRNNSWPSSFYEEVDDFEMLYKVYMAAEREYINYAASAASNRGDIVSKKVLENSKITLEKYDYEDFLRLAYEKANGYYLTGYIYEIKNGRLKLLGENGEHTVNIASADIMDNFNYSIMEHEDSEEELQAGSILVIPEYIDGKKVTEIDASAFENADFTNVVIQADLDNIGDNAFANNPDIENIIFSNKVSEIGDGAFANCDSLTTILLPEGIRKIGDNSFENDNGIETFEIKGYVPEFGNDIFAGCDNLTIIGDENYTNIEEYAAANGLGYIGNKAEVIKIKLNTSPDNNSFSADNIDTSGMSLQVFYTDGTSEIVTSGWICDISEDKSGIDIYYDNQMLHYNATILNSNMEYYVEYVDIYGNELAERKINTASHGTNIIEQAVAIPGYTEDESSKNLVLEYGQDTISFVYTKSGVDISDGEIVFESQAYVENGNAVNPDISVKLDGRKLALDRDYIAYFSAYSENETGSVIVEGINEYCGYIVGDFEILGGGSSSEDEEPVSWQSKCIRVTDTEYILNLATKEKYPIAELEKEKADGKNYKIAYPTKDDKKYASINAKGLISAKKEGVSKIALTKGNKTYAITVNVYNPQFRYADLKAKYYQMNAGEKIKPDYDHKELKAVFSLDKGAIKNNIATIDSDTGEITALKKGNVTITATVGEGKNSRKVTAKVKIYDPVISIKKPEVKVGKTISLSVKNGVSKPATQWSIQSGGEYAEIDSKGKLKGKAPGLVVVKAVNNGREMVKEITVLGQ